MSSKALFLVAFVVASLILVATANDDELKLTEIESPEFKKPAKVSSLGELEGPDPDKPEGPIQNRPKPKDPKPEAGLSESHAEVHESK